MELSHIAFAIAVGAVLGSSAASAATITESYSYSASTDWTDDLSVAGFSSALGTLTEVSITIKELLSGSLSLTNNGSDSTTVKASLINDLTYTLPGGTSADFTDSSNKVINNSLAGGATSGPYAVSGSATATIDVTDTTDLASYVTAGTWTLGLEDDGNLSLSAGNGNGSAKYTDNGGVEVTVTYTYDPAPIPEPLSAAILGSGLIGLGLIRWRR